MKRFNKFLCVLLSLVMLLTLLPAAAFADSGSTPNPAAQGVPGTGADGTVTLSVSVSALRELLSDRSDSAALLDDLRGLVDGAGSVISMDELLDIIPLENLMELILGENNEKVAALVEALGGMDEVTAMVDTDALILSVSDANLSALVDFVADLNDIASVINVPAVLDLDVTLNYKKILDNYVDSDLLDSRLDGLSAYEIDALLQNGHELKDILHYSNFLNAVVNGVKAGTLKDNNDVVLTFPGMVDTTKIDFNDFRTSMDSFLANSTQLRTVVDDLDAANVTIPESAYTVRTADLMANASIKTGLIDKLKEDVGGGHYAYENILTSEGVTAVEDAITAAGGDTETGIANAMDTIRTNHYYKDAEMKDAVLDVLDNTPSVNIWDYADVDADALLNDNAIKNFLTSNIFNYLSANDIADILQASGHDFDYYLKNTFDPFAVDDLMAIAKEHVNWDNALNTEYFDLATLISDHLLLPGEDLTDLLKKDANGSNAATMRALINDPTVVSISDVFNKIKEKVTAGTADLDDYISVSDLIDIIPSSKYGTLFGFFNRDTLINQLKPHAKKIFAALPNETKKNVATLAVSTIINQVDAVSVDGWLIASENDLGALSINASALANAVFSVLPSLNDLANLGDSDPLLAFNTVITYKTNAGDTVTKDVNFRLQLKSGVAYVRRLASLLNRYVSINKVGNQFSVTVNVPALAEEIYAAALESGGNEAVQSLREKLLSAEGMTLSEVLDLWDTIPLSEIVAALDDVDINSIYSRAVNNGIVEKALAKFNDLTGKSYTLASIDTLDELLDQLTSGELPSLEGITNRIQNRYKVDLMGLFEKVAKAADRNARVQSLLDKAASIEKLKPYVEGVSVAEILDTYKDWDPVEAVADYIAQKAGRDLLGYLQNHTAQELYHDALVYVDAHFAGAYAKVRTFAHNLADANYQPTNRYAKLVRRVLSAERVQALLNRSLVDLYDGNSTFSTGIKTVAFDVGRFSDRLLSLVNRVYPLSENTRSTIRNFLPANGTEVNFSVGLTVNFATLSKVTFLAEDGSEIMTTFLPAGVAPTVVKVPEVEGKTALYWADADGNEVTAIAGDCTLTATYQPVETQTVTFWFYDGKNAPALYGTVEIVKGATLTAAEIPTPAKPDWLVNTNYTLVILEGEGTDGARVNDITDRTVDEDVTYTLMYVPDFITTENGDIVSLTSDDQDNWTAQVFADDFVLNIDKTLGTLDNAKSLTVESENASMKLGPATLAALNAASTGKITLKSEKKEGTPLTFKSADGVYNCTINSFYTFDLLLDDVKYTQTPFPTDFEITLPFNALAASATQRSVVDVFDENGTITDTLTPTVGAGTVTFNPPHFSDYAVINEYQLTSEFVKGTAPFAGGSVKLNGVDLGSGKFIPENATVNNVTASLGTNAAGNKIKQITVDGTAVTSSFTMPSHATKVRVEVEDLTYKTYWLMPDGTVKDTEAEANAYLDSHAAPAGYEYKKVSGKYQYNGEAMDPTALQSDVYRTPILVAKNYTVTFQPGNGIANIVVNFTVNDIATFAPPAVPERKGYTGAWETYDLGAIVTGGNAVVKAQYTAVTYTVTYANGTTASVAFGTSVDPKTGYTPSTGMEPDEIAVWTENGKQVVTGNFEMPASDVRITISEKPMTVTVTIRNDSDNTTTTVSGPFGSSATFEIRLAKNQELTTAPAGAKLVAFSVLADGTRVLTYAVTLDASTLSGVTVSYATKALTPVSSQLVAGKVGADGKPEVSKGVEFTGYKVPSNGDSTFANVTYAFATYKAAETAKSLLWLWILIALLIFFLIVAIFYVLYIRGKLKPNPILRFFTWIVSIFFMICLGIASIALWIVHLFGGKKHDYEAFGIAEPDAKNADEEADGEENGEEAPVEAPAEEPVEEELAEDAPVEEETEEAPAEEEAEEAPAEENSENKNETDQPDAE